MKLRTMTEHMLLSLALCELKFRMSELEERGGGAYGGENDEELGKMIEQHDEIVNRIKILEMVGDV